MAMKKKMIRYILWFMIFLAAFLTYSLLKVRSGSLCLSQEA